ncbi:MAG: type II toxin-antitoxin system VapB family antitoxin [Bifidobacteriaceae bacterium]|jgi:Arc/MetJ family transcription regulator|nr:type II toxin-antitoxin system VapB family antitoxin [Bifidobacteriaceae bacterium]
MRTNIVIDDELMAQAMRASGASTKRQTVEEGLRALIRQDRAKAMRALRGKLHWEGDLDAERTDMNEPSDLEPW